tara:strand:+ start:59 stop:430 length:372 start_codon:yes stop_codon:yes gene_type:complete
MASKIKKLLKKVGKAALLGGGAYMAAKGLTGAAARRKQNKAYLATEGGDTSDMSIPYENEGSIIPAPRVKTVTKKRNMYSGDDFGLGPYDGAKDGGRMGLKGGGKAIKKSMGKALRGGGKVMR